MAELLQSREGPDGAGRAAATSLNALLKKSKKPAVGGRAPSWGAACALGCRAPACSCWARQGPFFRSWLAFCSFLAFISKEQWQEQQAWGQQEAQAR